MMVIGILIFFLGLYVLFSLVLQYGLQRPVEITAFQPTVSILIAARNEEKRLTMCLESIARLEYPRELLEVLILDDRSTDATSEIAGRFSSRYDYFKTVRIDSEIPGLRGKINALAQGIRRSTGEIILITDADCRVPTRWVTEFVKYFAPGVGLTGSMTLLESAASTGHSLFSQVQNLDWIFLQGVAAGIAGLGLPVTVLGNNFAFRRRAYDDTGGFTAIGFSLAEDMKLMQAIQQRGWKIRYPLQAGNAVYSEPLTTLGEFYRQRLRWVKGSITASWTGYALMSASFLAHAAIIAAVLIGRWNLPLVLSAAMVLLSDFIFINRLLKRFGLVKKLIYFPLFEIFYVLYTVVFAVLFFMPAGVTWKGRTYK
jgi:1,2-diacylglycerol 3-beta-glucosyltransferase